MELDMLEMPVSLTGCQNGCPARPEPKIFEDVQKGLLARPQRAKGRGVLFMYVEPRSEVRTQLEAIFNILNERGRPVSTGILRSLSHVELSGTRNPPGKCNCQSRTGTRSLINCDVLPSDARGGGRARCSGLVQGRCSAAEDENFLG